MTQGTPYLRRHICDTSRTPFLPGSTILPSTRRGWCRFIHGLFLGLFLFRLLLFTLLLIFLEMKQFSQWWGDINYLIKGSCGRNLTANFKGHMTRKLTVLFFSLIWKIIENCIFRFVTRQMVSRKKVHVQTTWNFRLQKIAQAVIKLVSQKW